MNLRVKRIIFNISLLLLFCLTPNLFANSGKPVSTKNGMVVSASTIASKVGVEILKAGGNAIDASVAVGFALAVTYPYAGNLGGGGFMVIHFHDGNNTTIDFRETAPLLANKNMFLDSNGNFISSLSEEGATSAGVPGSVSGLIYALEKYGTLTLSKVIQPAIDLAKKGWTLQKEDALSFKETLPIFSKYPSSLKVFSKEGEPYVEGDLFVQSELANTLELIKTYGTDGFYKGKVAELLVKQMDELGGYISLTDLENYKPFERAPIVGTYRDHEVVSMPPSSSGGIALVELLNILENFNFDGTEWGSSEYIRALVESMKYVYADRTQHLGDSDFYPVPVKKLISKEYAKLLFEKVKAGVTPSTEITSVIKSNYLESEETTHYSIIDKEGNAVSVTTTINSGFGSKVVVGGAGFLLNNEMDDFSSKPNEPNQYGLLGSVANSIEPGKRMLSSMTPTIILKNDKPFLILGSPGGSTIITVVLQVILNCIEFGMNIQEAVNAPRIHHQWLPDIIYHEQFSINNDTFSVLEDIGYKFKDRNSTFRVLGSAQAIMIDQEGNIYFGASDPRRNGSAEGY